MSQLIIETPTYRLTIDVDLMGKDKLSAMSTLKRWNSEGKVELIEAVRPKPEYQASAWSTISQPEAKTFKKNWRRKSAPKESSKGVNFRTVASVLYPTKDSQKLELAEMNNVAHLVKHHERQCEFFVTGNLKDFIESGKQGRLKASYGINAVSADELVDLLKEKEGWK